jgi:hypothetical protein
MRRFLKRCWRASFRYRRPFQSRFERMMTRCVAQALASMPVHASTPHVSNASLPEDFPLILDMLLSEQLRLQAQIEELHARLDAVLPAPEHPLKSSRVHSSSHTYRG